MLAQHLADALERRVARGVTVHLVEVVQVVGVGENERERPSRGTAPCKLVVERARVAKSGHEVAARVIAQPVDELAVAACVKAHERADDRERDEPDPRCRRQGLRRRHGRGEHHGRGVHGRRKHAGHGSTRLVSDEGYEANGHVEEVPDPEAGALHEDERSEDPRVHERRESQDQPTGSCCRRRHALEPWNGYVLRASPT